MRPRAEDPGTVVEERLRAAFAARAALVTHRDLRRDEPPVGRSWGLRRVRGVAFASLGALAAAAAAYLLVLVPADGVSPLPAPPARPPGVGESSAVPTPSPVAPSVTGPGVPPRPEPEAVRGPEGAPRTPDGGPGPTAGTPTGAPTGTPRPGAHPAPPAVPRPGGHTTAPADPADPAEPVATGRP
ncbi:hypothetical protein ACF09E_31395 [Streptomyces sp. NPDC014891]|uniref:hypothetical protein n=1 Tax=Streptomyces sp. NPDC014891 TaxID=3364929 RepID=UPI0036FD8C49